MHRKLLKTAVALGVILSMTVTAFADPTYDKAQLGNAQKNTQSIEGNIENLDDQIHNVNSQLSNTKLKISRTQKDIAKAEKDIKVAQTGMDEAQGLFNNRMRAMYMNGTNGIGGYIGVLLDSKGLSDFISRAETVKKLVELNDKTLSNLTAQRNAINKNKEKLNNENKKLLALKKDGESKLAKLYNDKNTQVVLIKQAKAQEQVYASKIAVAAKEVQAIRVAAPKYVPSRGSANVSSNSIVAYASNFLGRPYVYGGNGPSVFDCSGLTSYVFAHFGIGLNRTADAQATQGTPVSKDQLQPGDLVFFGSPIHHVGIYSGGGCFIEAPHTGANVRISSLEGRSDYTCARRM